MVRVVNGSALDLLHRAQMEKAHFSGRRHHVAVTWAHIHVAEFALSRSEYGMLIVEDDAQFVPNSAAYAGRMVANLTANGWQRSERDEIIRLGYHYMWARNCKWTPLQAYASVSAKKDIKSSVAVAYNLGAMRKLIDYRCDKEPKELPVPGTPPLMPLGPANRIGKRSQG